MKKKDDTIRQRLLDCAWDIITSEGPEAVNIRMIAGQAGIAVGTVYNYFENKNDILLAVTQEYWQKTLLEMAAVIQSQSFADQLKESYDYLHQCMKTSAGPLMASIQDSEAAAKDKMVQMQKKLQQEIMFRMSQDPDINQEIWSDTFTPEAYAGFILMNLIGYLRLGEEDISFFIDLVKRILY